MNDEIKNLIFKLNSIINGAGCTDGERDNALRLRSRILEKYGLKLEDIEPPANKTTYWFRYENVQEKRLLSQIVARIRDGHVEHIWVSNRRPHHIGMDLTIEEYETTKVKFKALRKDLANEIELCYRAFVQANGLGITPEDKSRELTREELKEIDDMLARAGLINKTKIPETRKERLIEK